MIRTAEARPRLAYLLADPTVAGAQAREVVQHYGERIGEHPVGTGPFRLKSWRRSSQIVLERNPGYRERFYEGHPGADDAEGQAILARFKGRRLPMVDEVEVSIVSESQPRWLGFLNGQVDCLAGQTGSVPGEFVPIAAPGGKLAPHLAKRGIQLQRRLNADCAVVFFNMRDPVVGGYTPEQVALRRRDPAEVRAWRKANIGTLWLTGAAIVFLGTIPILNLIVPVLGVAAMVHIAQMLRPPLNLPTSPR